MRQTFVINGSRFSTLEGFYDEVSSVLVPGQPWGRNLDAFNDVLSWPCGQEWEAPYLLVWQNSELSRERLGYAETERVLETRLHHGHPSNLAKTLKDLELARLRQGPTVFDWLIEIFRDNAECVELWLD
jgi:RNAse (barnase) inhibitor barstar